MELLSKPNFLLTLSELFSNLSAGWFGAVLILPGIWSSYDLQSNIVLFMFNIFYGFTCLLISYYLKELSYADWYSKNNTCCPKPFWYLSCWISYLFANILTKEGSKMEKVTFIDVITSPFVSFVLIPIIITLLLFLFQKDTSKVKKVKK